MLRTKQLIMQLFQRHISSRFHSDWPAIYFNYLGAYPLFAEPVGEALGKQTDMFRGSCA